MCNEQFFGDLTITIFYSLFLLIPGYFAVKLCISIYFMNIKEIIIYSLICSICFVIHNIFNLSDDYKRLKEHIFYLKH